MKTQKAWALVNCSGYILTHTVRYARRDVIDYMLKRHDDFRRKRHPSMTDAQFWRVMKRNYNWSVRRVELRVL